jgi:CRISPR-associated exonuclease Cas4
MTGSRPVARQSDVPCTAEVPFPVEYKRGKRRRWDNNDVQLCAQALCLEEMLGVAVPAGALYHVRSKRRQEIAFTPELRAKTEAAARRLHELVRSGITPPPVLKPRCRGCSLFELCMPGLFSQIARVAAYERALWNIDPGP